MTTNRRLDRLEAATQGQAPQDVSGWQSPNNWGLAGILICIYDRRLKALLGLYHKAGRYDDFYDLLIWMLENDLVNASWPWMVDTIKNRTPAQEAWGTWAMGERLRDWENPEYWAKIDRFAGRNDAPAVIWAEIEQEAVKLVEGFNENEQEGEQR